VFATVRDRAARNSIGAVLVEGMTVGTLLHIVVPSSTRSSQPITVPENGNGVVKGLVLSLIPVMWGRWLMRRAILLEFLRYTDATSG